MTLSAPAQAFRCYVVRGEKKDHNGAFTESPWLKEDLKVGGHRCEDAESWFDLNSKISAAQTKGDLKDGEEIFISQQTHGGPGGSALCNANEESPNRILAYLNAFAQKYRTSVVLNSCFSGDLLQAKLESDAIDPDPKRMKNLCLVSASGFGRLSRGNLIDPTALDGKSMEEAYLASWGGLISSAGWDSAGLTNYLLDSTLKNGGKALREIKQMIEIHADRCEELQPHPLATAKLCTSPKTTDTLLGQLGALEKGFQPVKWDDRKWSEDMNLRLKMLESSKAHELKKQPTPEKTENLEVLGQEIETNLCLQHLVAETLPNSDFDPYSVEINLQKALSHSKHQECLKKLKQKQKRSLKPNEVRASSPDESPYDLILQELPLELQTAWINYARAKKDLREYLEAQKAPIPNFFAPINVIESLALIDPKSPKADQETCVSEDRRKIVESAFGKSFFEFEYDAETRSPDTPGIFSPGRLGEAFCKASSGVDHFSSKNDEVRREACRNFKFPDGKAQH